jgi:hypothetical protein
MVEWNGLTEKEWSAVRGNGLTAGVPWCLSFGPERPNPQKNTTPHDILLTHHHGF